MLQLRPPGCKLSGLASAGCKLSRLARMPSPLQTGSDMAFELFTHVTRFLGKKVGRVL